MSPVTDPLEIASIKRKSWNDIHGWQKDGIWYAYDWSLDRYRARRMRAVGVRYKRRSWWHRMLAWVRGFWSREKDQHG